LGGHLTLFDWARSHGCPFNGSAVPTTTTTASILMSGMLPPFLGP